MLNQVIIVGRIANEIRIEDEEGRNKTKLVVAVPRSYKNSDGEYETDFVECTLWDAIAQNTSEYCRKGDIVGIKGRIQSQKIEDEYKIEIIAEKVTFLSSKKGEE